jgi:hypothetical protein
MSARVRVRFWYVTDRSDQTVKPYKWETIHMAGNFTEDDVMEELRRRYDKKLLDGRYQMVDSLLIEEVG